MIRYYSLFFFLSLVSILNGQNDNSLWINTGTTNLAINDLSKNTTSPQKLELFSLNIELLYNKLSKSTDRASANISSGVIINFPDDEGRFEKFEIYEASAFDIGLQIKFPDIKSYVGKSLDNSGARIRFTISPFGLNAMINQSDGKTITIKPHTIEDSIYSVAKDDLKLKEVIQCGLDAINTNFNSISTIKTSNFKNATDGILRTFRLAISTTSEYSLDVLTDLGIDVNAEENVKKSAVLAQINNIVAFLNEVYERDLGITFQLVADNDQIIFFDTATDGLPHADKFAVRDANQVVQDNIIGTDNYDIGHVFDFGGNGGVATIATVCVDGEKAKGASEISSLYYRNLVVAHEIGHQFGANHTFNKCSLPMVQSPTTVEPGSGTTIMSYAGGCGSNNVDVKGEYFHYINILEMWNNMYLGNSTCATQTPTNNNAPVINSLSNYIVPVSTSFALTADVTDANNDNLTYTWEQIDPELTVSPPDATSSVGPSFRSYPPNTSPERVFPNLETILSGNISNTWEVVPSVSRTMNFAVTVRDNNVEVGQTSSATTTLNFTDTSGPFLMTYPLTSEIWTIGDSKTITWDVAGTDLAPVNCSHVNILFSIDGGLTYNIVLATNTPNDGSESITVPDYMALHGRIKIESVGNIFFDVSPEIEVSIDGNPNTTAIPDSNFELELRNLGFDTDGVENGKVFTRDIESVTSLNVSNKSINDLTGIEDFISLIDLDCSINSITSLDLSSNLLLEELNCASNSINQLNISQNINLDKLLCNNNLFTSLNTSQNLNLTELYCNNNQLVSLDVSQNLNLSKLHCYSNQLTTLNFTANTKLIEVRCYFNQLTSIDISQNTLLNILWCFYNNLDDIDVSNNTNLTNLACYNNNLTSLDLSNNLNLTLLYCNNNQISSLDVSQNTLLAHLKCNINQLSSLNVRNGNNSTLGTFDASTNPLLYCIEVDNSSEANSGTGVYSSWIKDTYSKYYENCGTTTIPDPNFEQYLIDSGIDEDLVINQKVVTLDIVDEYYVTLPPSAGITDISGIEDFNNLYGLTISFNIIPEIDISNNTNLHSINAQNSGLVNLDISNNTLLTSIGISDNLIEELDLSNNTDLTFVNVSSNQIKKLDLSLNTNVISFFCGNNNLESLNVQNGTNDNFIHFDALNNPNLYCIKVDNEGYSNANWLNKDDQSSYSTNCDVVISPRIYLQGAMLNPNTGEESLMRDDLRVLGLLPTTSLYLDGLNCESSIFSNIGSNAIVDWVLIEIRDETDNTKIVSSQSALLQRDGDVVAIDGVSDLKFWLRSGSYFVAAKHRNHLGIMSANSLVLTETTSLLDFSNGNIATYGSHAQTSLGMPVNTLGLWSGDSNGNNAVQYSGGAPEGPSILSYVLNDPSNFLNLPTYSIIGYSDTDLNLDGQTQYAGGNSEMPFVLQNVLSNPTNFLGLVTWPISEQLPEN